MEDDLIFLLQMEDDLHFFQMEDNLNFSNGRRYQFFKWKTPFPFTNGWKTTSILQMEDDLDYSNGR